MRVNIRIEELLTSSTGTTTAAATTGFQTYEERKKSRIRSYEQCCIKPSSPYLSKISFFFGSDKTS
jgi:hypothetical protein